MTQKRTRMLVAGAIVAALGSLAAAGLYPDILRAAASLVDAIAGAL